MVIEYWIITLGRSGLMARFDEAGRLVEWTSRIRRASVFTSAEAGNAAIRSICRPEIAAAIASGRAAREYDEEQDETVLMDCSARHARPLRTPSIRLAGPGRSLDHGDEDVAPPMSARSFARQEFRDARRNPARQTEALFGPRHAPSEYTMPATQRARQGRAARMMALVPGA